MVSCLIFKIFSLSSPCHHRLLTSQSVFPPLFLHPLTGPALLHPELPGEAAHMGQEMSVRLALTCIKTAST